GVLIASAGYLSALHSDAQQEHVDALAQFGRHMGQIFQIVDDIIDIWADPEKSGKTPGTDLRESVFTLPVLHAMRQECKVGARLRELLSGSVIEDAVVQEYVDLIKRPNGRELAERYVEHFRSLAAEEMAKLQYNAVTEALRHLLAFSLDRLG